MENLLESDYVSTLSPSVDEESTESSDFSKTMRNKPDQGWIWKHINKVVKVTHELASRPCYCVVHRFISCFLLIRIFKQNLLDVIIVIGVVFPKTVIQITQNGTCGTIIMMT